MFFLNVCVLVDVHYLSVFVCLLDDWFFKPQCCGAGRSRGFLAGAGADLKFEMEP